MKKSSDLKMRSPSMQFYFRQFSGDENVSAMDLDTVGAHILLMCYAGASPERCQIPNNRDRMRRLLGQKDDENFKKIWDQLLEGAWKVSEDGKWLEQEGMLRALKNQKEFSKIQAERAKKRWAKNNDAEAMPEACQTDAGPMPNGCSASTSASTTTYIDPLVSKDTSVPPRSKKTKKLSTWPPAGSEVRANIFLTAEQQEKLTEALKPKEIIYWLNEIEGTAKDNLAAWKKKYKDHYRVILKWRTMKIERGFIWNDQADGYRFPDKKFQGQNFKSAAQQNHDSKMQTLETIIAEQADESS